MNWLDILLIIVNSLILIIGIVLIPTSIIKYKKDCFTSLHIICTSYWIFYIFLGWLFLLPFIVIDKYSGTTVGTITSVDKNFFGTTAVYIKTTETNEEKYCIEFDKKLENQAKELVGKRVQINYGERVGIYSTGKCHKAPIEEIKEIENEINDK